MLWVYSLHMKKVIRWHPMYKWNVEYCFTSTKNLHLNNDFISVTKFTVLNLDSNKNSSKANISMSYLHMIFIWVNIPLKWNIHVLSWLSTLWCIYKNGTNVCALIHQSRWNCKTVLFLMVFFTADGNRGKQIKDHNNWCSSSIDFW